MSTSPLLLDPNQTSLEWAQANQLRASTNMVAGMNDQLKAVYLQAFANWKVSVDAGRTSNENPPKPPKGYVVGPPDANGFQWPIPSNDPVCAMPPIPEDAFHHQPKVPNTIHVGKSIGGGWFSVGAGDTMPSGFITPPVTSEDGVFGTFQKFGAPVGPGWYRAQ